MLLKRSLEALHALYVEKGKGWSDIVKPASPGARPPKNSEKLHLIHAVQRLLRWSPSHETHTLPEPPEEEVLPVPPSGRIEVPDWALDKHTGKGKAMGRGIAHFFEVGCELVNTSIDDPYKSVALALELSGAASALPVRQAANIASADVGKEAAEEDEEAKEETEEEEEEEAEAPPPVKKARQEPLPPLTDVFAESVPITEVTCGNKPPTFRARDVGTGERVVYKQVSSAEAARHAIFADRAKVLFGLGRIALGTRHVRVAGRWRKEVESLRWTPSNIVLDEVGSLLFVFCLAVASTLPLPSPPLPPSKCFP
jgi:hypothetical protein